MKVLYDYSTINTDSIIYRGDCLDVMPILHAKGVKVDLVLADPPYGTTRCKWDSVIDFNKMWSGVNSLSYPTTPILLFCQQPFTSTLGNSNIKNLRYSWVWEKTSGKGFLNANKMPLKYHEDVLVFYKKLPYYNPIKTQGHIRKIISAKHREVCEQGELYNNHDNYTDYDSTERFPRSILKFKSDTQTSSLHPTQKPVALLEYLIKTYTNEGDTVLDFVMGSGSTGVACKNTGRKFIGIEKEIKYFLIAQNRLIS